MKNYNFSNFFQTPFGSQVREGLKNNLKVYHNCIFINFQNKIGITTKPRNKKTCALVCNVPLGARLTPYPDPHFWEN
jgi:hypothetical protein